MITIIFAHLAISTNDDNIDTLHLAHYLEQLELFSKLRLKEDIPQLKVDEYQNYLVIR